MMWSRRNLRTKLGGSYDDDVPGQWKEGEYYGDGELMIIRLMVENEGEEVELTKMVIRIIVMMMTTPGQSEYACLSNITMVLIR